MELITKLCLYLCVGFQSLVRWCDSSPCKNGGSCWQQGSSFTCQCASGWTGIYCDVPSVSCEVAAQQQGNVFILSMHLFYLRLLKFFPTCTLTLSLLSLSVHPFTFFSPGVSVAALCRNGGQCVDAGSTHLCRCQAGYMGSYCQEQVDECVPNPCHNGATCTDYLGGYTCEVCNDTRISLVHYGRSCRPFVLFIR